MRLIKQVLKNTFPNVAGPIGVTSADLSFGIIPIGGIIMWSGTLANMPLGFHACDGTLGTPDLRDRFVVGAGLSYGQNTAGGSLGTSFDGVHNHPGSGTDIQGGHTHNTTISSVGSGSGS